MNNKMPASILHRTKQPYRAPVSNMFINEDAPDYIKFILSDQYILHTGIFNKNSITRFLGKLRNASSFTELESMFLTAVVSTQILYYQYIEKNSFGYNRENLIKLKIIEDF